MSIFNQYSREDAYPFMTLKSYAKKVFTQNEQTLLDDVLSEIKTFMNKFPDFPKKKGLIQTAYLWSKNTIPIDLEHIETWKAFTVIHTGKLIAQWIVDDLFDKKCKPGDVSDDVMDYISKQFSAEHGDPLELPPHLKEIEVATEILRTVSSNFMTLGGCPDLWKLCVSDFRKWVFSYQDKINFKAAPPSDLPTYYANRWRSVGISGCLLHSLYLKSCHYDVRVATDLLINANITEMEMTEAGNNIYDLWFLSGITCADYNDIVSQKDDIKFGVPSLCNLKDQLEDGCVFKQLQKNVDKLLSYSDRFASLTEVIMEVVIGNAFFHMEAEHRYDTKKYIK